jgi:hypothetical protein
MRSPARSGVHLHHHHSIRHLRPALGALALLCALATLAAGCGGDGGGPAGPSPRAGGAGADPQDLATVGIAARVGGDVVRSSGVVVDAGDGLVLTTAHTLWGARSLKVSTNVGVLHGRVVARDACDDLAVVQTQPRLPGLVAMRLAPEAPTGLVTAVGRRWERTSGRQERTLVTIPARVEEPRKGGGALAALRLAGAAPLSGTLVPDASGGPVLDGRGRFVGLAAVDPDGRAVTIPGRLIAERFDQLDRGRTTVYVGWREHYRCSGRLHALAADRHAGYRPADARLNAPVDTTRLVPTEKEDSR